MRLANKAASVLAYLHLGHRITLQDRTYAMSDDMDLALVCPRYNTDNPEVVTEIGLGLDMRLKDFLALVETIDDKEMVRIRAVVQSELSNRLFGDR